ncbi:MAG: heavy-metal-associated domain-containing protein [Firmicutes bacterium]|nr:heavy-metal-associated domain-containing protein [Bacillota bacterium]
MEEVYVFSTPDISCAHCEKAIQDELILLESVTSVEVDLGAKKVSVTGENLDTEEIIDAIGEAGYTATPI